MKLERNDLRENQIVCRSSLLYREHVSITRHGIANFLCFPFFISVSSDGQNEDHVRVRG